MQNLLRSEILWGFIRLGGGGASSSIAFHCLGEQTSRTLQRLWSRVCIHQFYSGVIWWWILHVVCNSGDKIIIPPLPALLVKDGPRYRPEILWAFTDLSTPWQSGSMLFFLFFVLPLIYYIQRDQTFLWSFSKGAIFDCMPCVFEEGDEKLVFWSTLYFFGSIY